MTQEVYICSFVVFYNPDFLDGITDFIARLEGVEIHAGDNSGKLVIVVEQTNSRAVTGAVDAIAAQHGVYQCALIYQEVLDETSDCA